MTAVPDAPAGPGFAVPTVDIGPYVAGGSATDQRRVAREIDDAARTVGFMQILGHGIDTATQAGLAAAMDSFFDLPLDRKVAYRTPPEINRGYAPPKSESLSLSLGLEAAGKANDFFEAFNIGVAASDHPGLGLPREIYAENLWPAEVAGFAAAVSRYFDEAARVARTLTTIFADALELPPGFFAGYTDHSLDVMRMNNYALPPGPVGGPTPEEDPTGMGAHTDFGIVTVLWADQVAGLQVLDRAGGWHDVCPADAALLVNLGDLTARWTNERWLSTLHRVRPPIVDGTIRRRRSAAFFHDGNVDATISTLPSCLGPGEMPRYEPITIADHIQAKLGGSRAGKANPRAAREAARVLSAGDR
ncbi:MAG: isopenicillin N synthase family dioxygenase [Frankia sp.]